MVFEITDNDFVPVVLNNKLPVLLDFWADWCVPCKHLSSNLEELSEEYHNKIVFVKMNVDENTNVPKEYGIRSIPYILLFRDGDILDSLVGNQSKEKIEYFLESML